MITTRQTISLVLLVSFCTLLGAGCTSLFQKKAPEQSLPVLSGAASTNDTQAVAWLRYALELNHNAPATAAQPIIDATLGAGIAIASGISGWMARHKAATPTTPKPS